MNRKKILILGGTSASLDIVRIAKEMGVYTVVTDDQSTGVAKAIADETAMVSTTDMSGLQKLIQEKQIDGAFCGPSEFNLRNLIHLCELTGLPCYATKKLWDLCADKDVFKRYCREYGVDCTPEYTITEKTTDAELESLEFPIILKPVDGCSSKGITVCQDKSQVRAAYQKAMDASTCKRIIAEKYIENNGELFGVRYLLRNGEAYPYFLMDTYVADPIHRTSLISGFTYAPSKYAAYYMKHMDLNVRKMLKGMGLKNGTAFFQSLPYQGKIYFHEMGYRLSGGMLFKLTEPLVGVNDMRMMLRFALGGEMITDDEIAQIDVNHMRQVGAQLMIPLNTGKIGRIEGFEATVSHPMVKDFIQYYKVGDCITKQYIGTLSQHFGRFTLVADNKRDILDTVNRIQHDLLIYDTAGKRMNTLQFDIKRI